MNTRKTQEQFEKELTLINPNIEVLGKYLNAQTKILCRCKIDSYKWDVTPEHLLQGHGCPKCKKNKRYSQEEFEKELFEINPNIEVLGEYTGVKNKIYCRCKIDGYEWMAFPNHLLQGHNCPVCTNRKVIKGINDLWTTNPELAKLLVNTEDGYKYTYGSTKRLDWKCPNCSNIIKNERINNVYHKGLSCPKCSDGISYPEKFIYNLLQQLNVDFNYQLTKNIFQWCDKYRYDFYLPILNYIIETHGLQHYEEGSGNWEAREEIVCNDKFKKKLARENGIDDDHYIVIDCRYSTMEWIRDHILSSRLAKIFDLSTINWEKINEQCQKSLVKQVCNLWNSGIYNTKNIADKTFLSNSTIIKYLKCGEKLKWCNYNPKLSNKLNILKAQNSCKKNVICTNNYQIFYSIKNAALQYNINPSCISNNICHKSKSAGKLPDGTKLHWMYLDEYMKQNGYTDVSQIPNVIIHNEDQLTS